MRKAGRFRIKDFLAVTGIVLAWVGGSLLFVYWYVRIVNAWLEYINWP